MTDKELLQEGLTICLVSPDDREKLERVHRLIDQGLMRGVLSYSLADFFTFETTSAGYRYR